EDGRAACLRSRRVAKGPKLISVTHLQLYWALAIAIAIGLVGAGVSWAVRGRVRQSRPEAPRANAASSETDAITGLMARAAFETELAHALDTERGAERTGALLYAGLDGFRLVNEGHGHAQGDKVLAATARRLRELCGQRVPMCRM